MLLPELMQVAGLLAVAALQMTLPLQPVVAGKLPQTTGYLSFDSGQHLQSTGWDFTPMPRYLLPGFRHMSETPFSALLRLLRADKHHKI